MLVALARQREVSDPVLIGTGVVPPLPNASPPNESARHSYAEFSQTDACQRLVIFGLLVQFSELVARNNDLRYISHPDIY